MTMVKTLHEELNIAKMIRKRNELDTIWTP